jgi:hypothetical protein
MIHLFYHCIQLWYWKESKTITIPKPVTGPKLPQNLRFIIYLFTTTTLLVKYILRIFQTRSGKVKVPPVSQFGFRVRPSVKITDHVVLNFKTTVFMGVVLSDPRESSDATWHSGFL